MDNKTININNKPGSNKKTLKKLAHIVFVNNWALKLTAIVSAFIFWLVMSIT